MHTEKEHIDPDELAKMGYERRDVNTKILGKVVLVFYGFAVICSLAAAYILYWGTSLGPIQIDPYVKRTTVREKNEAANAVGRILPQYPNPLLQGNVTSKLDMQTLRQAEDARLDGTGYTDETQQKAFIPIDRAIDLISQRGLPKTQTEAAVTRGNDMDPFGTATVPPPNRTGAAGETSVGGNAPTSVDPRASGANAPANQGTGRPVAPATRPGTPRPSAGTLTPAPQATADPIERPD